MIAASSCESYGILQAVHATTNGTALHRDCRSQWRGQDHLRARRAERADFAFESTLSGLSYARQLGSWKGMGYRIEIAYLRLSSSQLALRRIAARVRQGGPDVPRS